MWPTLLSNLFSPLVNNCSFFKQNCLLCATADAENGFCTRCRDSLVRMPPCCPRCATPLYENRLCGRCQRHPPSFDALHIPYVFCYPMDGLIHSFKYGKRFELAGALCTLFAQNSVPIPRQFDIVVAVPLAKERLAERGFNQSDELARALTGTPSHRLDAALCWRKHNTPAQASLGPRARQQNMRDAFCVKRSIDGCSVAIVDDVVTTGATLNALALSLKKQGAKRVEAWALTRTLASNT